MGGAQTFQMFPFSYHKLIILQGRNMEHFDKRKKPHDQHPLSPKIKLTKKNQKIPAQKSQTNADNTLDS